MLVKIKPEGWERYGLKSWIEAAKKRLHHNVLAIALANKLAGAVSSTTIGVFHWTARGQRLEEA